MSSTCFAAQCPPGRKGVGTNWHVWILRSRHLNTKYESMHAICVATKCYIRTYLCTALFQIFHGNCFLPLSGYICRWITVTDLSCCHYNVTIICSIFWWLKLMKEIHNGAAQRCCATNTLCIRFFPTHFTTASVLFLATFLSSCEVSNPYKLHTSLRTLTDNSSYCTIIIYSS